MKVFAVDASGSVGGYSKYWAIVKKLFQELKNQNNWTYVAWGGSQEVHSLPNTERYLLHSRNGEYPNLGSTCPDKIFQVIPRNTVVEEFVFITDGEIGQGEVDQLEVVLREKELSFSSITCHIINASPNINLSTVCSFNRYPNVETYTHNTTAGSVAVMKTPTAEEFTLIDDIDKITLADFNAHYDKIYQVLVSMFMGKGGNEAIHTKLVEAKKRLTKQLANEETIKAKDKLLDLTIDNAQYLIDEYYSGGVVADFASKIDRLVTMASRGLRNEFSSNLFDIHSVRNASTIQPATWNEDAEDDTTSAEEAAIITKPVFECPILLSESCPVLLITEGDAILHQLPKKQVDNIRRNPLSCIGSKEIQSRIRARILPYVIGQETVRALQEEGQFIDPYTRKPVVGYIPLDIAHMSMANMNIALLFGDMKLLGNLDLFFIALYMIFRDAKKSRTDESSDTSTVTSTATAVGNNNNKESWIRNDDWEAVMNYWEKQLDHRLYHAKTTISLCGLPNYLMHKVPLYQGIWFVLASGILRFPDESIRPLRAHIYTTHALMELHARSVSYGWAPSLTDNMIEMIDATYVMLRLLHDCKMFDPIYWEGLVMSLTVPWKEVDVPVNMKKRKRIADETVEEDEAVAMAVVTSAEETTVTATAVSKTTCKRIWKLESDPTYEYSKHPYFQQINASLFSSKSFSRAHFIVYTKKVNRQLSASNIPIDLKDIANAIKQIPAMNLKKKEKEDSYFWYRPSPSALSDTDRALGYTTWCQVKICPWTCRPYSEEALAVDTTNRPIAHEISYPWKDAMEIKFQAKGIMYLSLNEWFGRFVMDYGTYPTEIEFWHFVQSRKLKNERPMPTNHEALWKDLLIDYDELLVTIQPDEFARRFEASTTMIARKQMEMNGCEVPLESVLKSTHLAGMIGIS